MYVYLSAMNGLDRGRKKSLFYVHLCFPFPFVEMVLCIQACPNIVSCRFGWTVQPPFSRYPICWCKCQYNMLAPPRHVKWYTYGHTDNGMESASSNACWSFWLHLQYRFNNVQHSLSSYFSLSSWYIFRENCTSTECRCILFHTAVESSVPIRCLRWLHVSPQE